MSSFTITQFSPGDEVAIVPRTSDFPPTAITEKTRKVPRSGELEVDGLADNAPYWAVAEVPEPGGVRGRTVIKSVAFIAKTRALVAGQQHERATRAATNAQTEKMRKAAADLHRDATGSQAPVKDQTPDDPAAAVHPPERKKPARKRASRAKRDVVKGARGTGNVGGRAKPSGAKRGRK